MEQDELFVGEQQTLAEAKQWLRSRLERGARCPCCTQMAKIYQRALASSLTAALIALYRLTHASRLYGTIEYFHVNDILARARLKASVGREFSIVRYWDLTREKALEGGEVDRRTSGYWTITERGVAFVEQRILVPSHVRLYDSRRLGFAGKEVSVLDCLKKKFSYAELMEGM